MARGSRWSIEDAYVAWLEGKPIPKLRHPRRKLRDWLFGRTPDPAPMVAQTETATWLRSDS